MKAMWVRRRLDQQGHRGITLIELTISGCIGLLVVSVAINLAGWVGRNTAQIRARSAVASEVKMVVDMIARDLGPAVAAQSGESGGLQIAIEGLPHDGVTSWQAPDQVVEYVLSGRAIIRRTLPDLEGIVIARPVTAFAVTMSPSGIVVTVESAKHGESCSATLHIHLP